MSYYRFSSVPSVSQVQGPEMGVPLDPTIYLASEPCNHDNAFHSGEVCIK